MNKFQQGDKVIWRYRHWIGQNWHWVMKTGVFEREIAHRTNTPIKHCYIRFDGNKSLSNVPIRELYPSRMLVTLRREVG